MAREFDVEPVQPLRFKSRIGATRTSRVKGNSWQNTYPEQYRPKEALVGHLEFLLKHERIHLELLARLFARIDPAAIERWVQAEPTGKYSRRAGFLYEWLTGKALNFHGVQSGSYVDALESDLYFSASQSANNTRWRVRDNLPGLASFCPLILLTDLVKQATAFDVALGWAHLAAEFGEDYLSRSAVWLAIKESRSSFAIEGESDQKDRIHRFATVLEREVGRHEEPLSESVLLHLQREILGSLATRHGLRRSPIFVGESRREIVHYIGPSGEQAERMLSGLAASELSTRGRNSLLRATVLSFGFVYIHPMTDGNGRISRFLVNDTLRRDHALPEPFVLPISKVMSSKSRDYDRALELFSKPFMYRFGGAYHFDANQEYGDGFTSNFHFDAYAEAEPTWRFPDLTDHVEYLSSVVRTTIDREMREEAEQIRAYRKAREAVNGIVEGPDQDLERIVRSVHDNGWQISNKLRTEFPMFDEEHLAERIVTVIRNAFEGS